MKQRRQRIYIEREKIDLKKRKKKRQGVAHSSKVVKKPEERFPTFHKRGQNGKPSEGGGQLNHAKKKMLAAGIGRKGLESYEATDEGKSDLELKKPK